MNWLLDDPERKDLMRSHCQFVGKCVNISSALGDVNLGGTEVIWQVTWDLCGETLCQIFREDAKYRFIPHHCL